MGFHFPNTELACILITFVNINRQLPTAWALPKYFLPQILQFELH